jgi:hypothetical protein
MRMSGLLSAVQAAIADLGVALVELFAYAADEFSYRQDAVALAGCRILFTSRPSSCRDPIGAPCYM